MIDVSCGLIINNQFDVLMTLRPPDKLRPNMWEMPGGKRERDETDQACLARELLEELGVVVDVHPRLIATDTFEWDDASKPGEFLLVRCNLYRAVIKAGNPQPLEAAGLAHYDMTYALRHVAMCPSAYKFYPYVVRYIDNLKRLDALR